jgi:tRNA threonylcarbamoyladenosine biosynthesis protein TsaB
MALLILDGAGPGVRASVPGFGAREAARAGDLAAATAALLAEGAIAPGALEAIVGMVGPGSFTGLRAALALAQGLAAGSRVRLVAVAAAEAFAHALPGQPVLAAFAGGRAGRFVLQAIAADGAIADPAAHDAGALRSLVVAPGTVLAGPAARELAILLRAAAFGVACAGAGRPPDDAIEAVARARLAGRIGPRAAVPLYADDLFARPGG